MQKYQRLQNFDVILTKKNGRGYKMVGTFLAKMIKAKIMLKLLYLICVETNSTIKRETFVIVSEES